jgi:curved DNA-binding protein CbpA
MPADVVRVPPDVSKSAKALINGGKKHEGLTAILVGKVESGGEDITSYFEHELQRLISDRYEGLGVEAGCEPKDVKKAYRKLVLKYHPDKNAHTTRIYQVVQEAYEILSEPAKRKEHGRGRRNKPSKEWKPPPPRGKPKARPAPPRPKPSYASKPKARAPPKPKQSAQHQRPARSERHQQQQNEEKQRQQEQQQEEEQWTDEQWAEWNATGSGSWW